VRAPHLVLEKETRRGIGLFPEMMSGKQGDKPVKIKYVLLIIFKIQD